MNKDLHGEHAFIARDFARERTYWLDTLSGDWEKSAFPYDFKPAAPHGDGPKMETFTFRFPPGLFSTVSRVMNGSDPRLQVILTAGMVLLLDKYTGNNDIVIGTTIQKQDVEGEFVNTVLALRTSVDPGTTFRELLPQTLQTIAAAEENQNYPVETLPHELNIPYPEGGDFPLFDVVLLLENIQDKGYLGDIRVNTVFSFLRTPDALEGVVEYDTSRFHRATIERIAGYYILVLEKSLANPDLDAVNISLLSDTEKKRLLIDFNNTDTDYPRNRTVHELFRRQVEKTPDRSAVLEAESGRQISYRELNENAGRTARILMEKGVGPGSFIPIMGQRKIEIITGIFGILKAGGAYLPIDATSPPDRVKFILRDSGAEVLLTQTHLIREHEETFRSLSPGKVIAVDGEAAPRDRTLESAFGKPADPVYVIYTSGTTGRPKGVVISHRAAVNYLAWAAEHYVNDDPVNFPLYSSISFDMTVTSLFTPLLTGNTLILYGGQYSQVSIENILKDTRVNILKLTPSHLQLVRNKEMNSAMNGLRGIGIKKFIVGGEELDARLAGDIYARFNGNVTLYNEYGPTEATVGCMIHRFDPRKDSGNSVPIGVPVNNTKIFLLDKNRDPVPVGVTGEIHIAGDGIADGYLNRPELTAQRFYRSYKTYKSYRTYVFYKTGDLARWLPDGTVAFLGRIDQQVKIRGFRIEPGEIENRLLDYGTVKEALVLPREDRRGDKYLCAYIVPRSAGDLNVSRLRDSLVKELPDYMIPAFFVPLDEMPLTPNGKINRNALPEPELKTGETYTPPGSRMEKKLLEIWSGILGIEKDIISIDTSFFELGGHSLSATVLSAKIHKECNVNVSLVDIFEKFTVRKLAGYIEAAAVDTFIAVPPVEKKEYYALSSAQKRLYVLQLMEPESPGYNIPIFTLLEGDLDKQRLESTFQTFIRRHEILRTSVEWVESEPVQRVHDEVGFELEYYEAGEDEALKVCGDFIRFFDLGKAPLFRVGLIGLAENRHVLMLDMHHITSDEVSLDIFIKETVALYEGQELPELSLQYKDFSEWQNSAGQRAAVERQGAYWLKEFAGEVPFPDLPTDFPRPAVQDVEGDHVSFYPDPREAEALKKLAQCEGATMFMVILAVYTILLSKLTGQQDIVVGSPVAGRRHADLEPIIGMFVNTLSLRTFPMGDKTFTGFLGEVRAKTLAAFDNQEYPFEDLVEKLSVERDIGRNPLFDVMFQHREIKAAPGGENHKLKLEPFPNSHKVSKFDLTLTASEASDHLFFIFEYRTRLFNEETIERFSRYFKAIALSVIQNPQEKISHIEVMTEEEKNRVLYGFNDTETGYPADKTLHRLFEEQAARTPDHIAVVEASGQHLSYKQLDKKSHQSAYRLSAMGVVPGTIVGIKTGRSVEMIAGLLGILKAGAAYLPIDPGYPQERINYMLADSNAAVLLKDVGNRLACSATASCSPTVHRCSAAPGPSGLAYVIYTSGSTGTPKGVMIEHHSVINRLNWGQEMYPIGRGDVVIQKTPVVFDVSVWELFWWSFTGAGLYLLGPGDEKDPRAIVEAVGNSRVTTMHFVPSMLNAFLSYIESAREEEKVSALNKLKSLRQVFSSGEALGADLVKRFYRLFKPLGAIKLVNLYGPTEATVEVSYFNCSPGEEPDNIPIGKPIHNTRLYVLSDGLHPQPIGVTGQLYISGVQLARGYLNRPELSKEKFIENPYIPGERMYSTGDLVKLSPPGDILYLGRADHQVKIRGFRIEPGEIENRLSTHKDVKEAVVIARSFETGDNNLHAYIVPVDGTAFEKTPGAPALRQYLSQFLPDHMIPSSFTPIDKIPLTLHGKIDRRALPAPEVKTGAVYTAPGNEVEKKLAAIWTGVLDPGGNTAIGIDDSFFRLGGHSLKAAVMVARIHKELNILLPLVEVFKTPTIRGLAGSINRRRKTLPGDRYEPIRPVEKKEYYDASYAQRRLWMADRMKKGQTAYNIFYSYLFEDLDYPAFERVVETVVRRHEILRTVFVAVNGEPKQVIRDYESGGFEMEYIDLRKTEDPGKSLEIISDREANRAFDLAGGPLLKTKMFLLDEKRSAFLVVEHHIISDGWSLEILIDEIKTLYNAYREGEADPLPTLPVQYKDFAAWQNNRLSGDVLTLHRDFWHAQFQGEIPVLQLETDFPRPPVKTFNGAAVPFELDNPISSGFISLGKDGGVSLFMVLTAVVITLLYKLTGQEDIVVGLPVSGREHADLQRQVGFYVNTLALRAPCYGNEGFDNLLGRIEEKILALFEHQVYPFDLLVEHLDREWDISRSPLFDVVVQFLDFEGIGGDPGGGGQKMKEVSPGYYNVDLKTCKYDLVFNFARTGDSLFGAVLYNTDLFEKESILIIVERLKLLSREIISNPGLSPDDIGIEIEIEKAIKKSRDTLAFDFESTGR